MSRFSFITPPAKGTKAQALYWLGITIFVLLSVPRMNIRVGPIPLYLLDPLILISAYYAQKLTSPHRRSYFTTVVGIILFFAVFSELYGAVEITALAESVYLMVRTLLAGSVFFTIRKVIANESDLIYILKPALIGCLVTAVMLILTSIPPTRGLATNLLSIRFLEPAAEKASAHYAEFMGAMRGRSYVGVSILSGAFLNSIWPILLLHRESVFISARWRRLIFIASFVIPIAVMMTYSRGAIIGTILVVAAVVLFNSGNFRRQLLVVMGLSIMGILYVGIDSQYFFFRRLEYSVNRVVEEGATDPGETERVYAYIEPFEHLLNHPKYFFFGEGLAYRKAGKSQFFEQENRADHAVFARAYYAYGMIAAILYIFLMLNSITRTLNYIVQGRSPTVKISKVLFASLLGFLPWFTLGHAAISMPHGAALAFFVFSLVSIQASIKPYSRND